MKNIIKTTLAIIALSASALSYAASPQMVSRSEAASLQKLGWSLPVASPPWMTWWPHWI